jgi:hypothetical protein
VHAENGVSAGTKEETETEEEAQKEGVHGDNGDINPINGHNIGAHYHGD